jgi:DNA-binding CsgD family transcriptional regulator
MASSGENYLVCPNCRCGMQLSAVMKETPPQDVRPTTAGRFHLTPRESQIADILLDGLPNKEIADMLGMSTQVVKNNLKRIFDKVGCDNRAAFVRIVLTGNARRSDTAAPSALEALCARC